MPQIVINLSDGTNSRVEDAFSRAYNFNPDNDESKEEFLKRMLVAHMKEVVKGQEREAAALLSRQNIDESYEDPDIT